LAIEGILALEEMGVTNAEATIRGEIAKAQACAKTGVPKIPGIPDIPSMINAWIISNWEGLKIEIRNECETFLTDFESDSNMRVVTEVNKFIKKLNGFVVKLNKLMDAILGLLAPLCPIIIAISIIMIVAKVVTLIPSFGAGLGAVVVATMPGQIAQVINTFAADVLNKINKVPFALIGVMNMIIAMYQYIEVVYNRLMLSIQRQQDLLANMVASLLRTADDWLDIDYGAKADADYTMGQELAKLNALDKFASDMVQLGKDFKDAVSDIGIRLGLQLQINNLEAQIVGTTGIQTTGTGPTGQPPEVPSPFVDSNGNTWVFQEPQGPWVLQGVVLGGTATLDEDGNIVSIVPQKPQRPEKILFTIKLEDCPKTTPPTDAVFEKYPAEYIDECGDKWVSVGEDWEDKPIWEKDGSNIFDESGTDTGEPTGRPPEVSSPFIDNNGDTWVFQEPQGPWVLQGDDPGAPAGDLTIPGELAIPELPLIDEFGNVWDWQEDPSPGDWALIATPPLPADTPLILDGDLGDIHAGLVNELDKLGGPLTQTEIFALDVEDRIAVQGLFSKLDNTIITSLVHPHNDITVQKATANKGKRYGFYQSDIKQ